MHLVTAKSLENLKLGRKAGRKYPNRPPQSEKEKQKRSKALKRWCRENPDKLKARGAKCRAENHYKWKGGTTKLNISIRRMTENRNWMEAVKKRDGECRLCGGKEELEADHIISLALLLERYKIKNRDEARACKELWDIENGITLCRRCHCKKDNKKYTKNGYGRRKTL